MTSQRLMAVTGLFLAGILLFLSWYLPADHGAWAVPDHAVFRFFNEPLAHNNSLAVFVAIINNRAFDLAALLLMGIIWYSAFRGQDTAGKRRLVMAGVVMLLSAVIVNQAGQVISPDRLSPTLALENVNRVGDITGIYTKDASKTSFPGDHGLMLMIFAAFVWRYAGLRFFPAAVLVALMFSLPRVMAGAHWFSDIMAGSLSLTLTGMSLILLTRLSDYCVNYLDKKLPDLPGLPAAFRS